MGDAARGSADHDRPTRIQRLVEEVARRRSEGESLPDEEVLYRHRDLLPELKQQLDALAAIAEQLKEPPSESLPPGETLPFHTSTSGQYGNGSQEADFGPLPATIGRYAVRARLGGGGFGTVYRGYDAELQREVAIKVPRPDRIHEPADIEPFLAEARLVATLEHPHIVPVYDCGRSEDGLCYVVSRLIDGSDLRKRLPLPDQDYAATARLIATVAEALHYAHEKDITHRDIKPENILIDGAGQPHVADFGLALRDEHFGKGSGYAGTPLYWSPEQARGEGHRVDGRSDIFSLGVVLYEMLTGRRPFKGSSSAELARCIQSVEVRRPRRIETTIPRELERICLQALSKRTADRYATAREMAKDLLGLSVAPVAPRSAAAEKDAGDPPRTIIPRGLRSFDRDDSDFFPSLLPGPRDRDGLPQSIRFWKSRIEETDSDQTFEVGLIYGPSGCGKSSLVKAGLLPRLATHIAPVYVEATPADTETRLLRALRRRWSELPPNRTLVETMTAIRCGQGLPAGEKVLIVLDQFEQWLHARPSEHGLQLVQALRQCDGAHLQCLVLVRDDFWLAVSRFMQELEIRLVEAENSQLVDLFDPRHARSVLVRFGEAFGALPQDPSTFTPSHRQFLDEVVESLAVDGKINSVRLALFAEMVKGRPWTPATLREVGGTEGIGVAFLEETFRGRTAPPEHRLHENAARSVLGALLPDVGSDIVGGMRSRTKLLEVAGYASRPREFAELLAILDKQLRLITPTDPEGQDRDEPPGASPERSDRYYQLTHDYLVHSLRQWLTRKQLESRSGRAEIRLAERAALWNLKPEHARLPDLWEYLSIVVASRWHRWNTQEMQLMTAATRYYATRIAAVALLMSFLAWGVYEALGKSRASAVLDTLVKAGPDKVLEAVDQIQPYLAWVDADLQQRVDLEPETDDQGRQQLHARLALVATDASQVAPLVESLLTAAPDYVGVIRDVLRPRREQIIDDLWDEFHREHAPAARRFRAGLALAGYAPTSEQWEASDFDFIAEQLVTAFAEYQPIWRADLRPISGACLPALEQWFQQGESSEARLGAAKAIAQFAADDQERIAELIAVATPGQFDILFPLIEARPGGVVKERLAQIAAAMPPDDLSSEERIPYGRRRAGAGITLLRLGERDSVLPTFEVTDDPEAASQFVDRCRDRGVRAAELLECLRAAESMDQSPESLSLARYALLLALAEYPSDAIPATERKPLIASLADWYASDPSSAVHAAAGWLLRAWEQDETVRQVDQTPRDYDPDREWFTLAVTVTGPGHHPEFEAGQRADDRLTRVGVANPGEAGADESAAAAKSSPSAPTSLDDGPQGASDAANRPRGEVSRYEPLTFYYTFVVFPPGVFPIGPVGDEADRSSNETSREIEIAQPFALLDREVSFAELTAFDPQLKSIMEHPHIQGTPADPATALMWYEAVGFCRWLSDHAGCGESEQAYPDPTTLDLTEFPRESDPQADWAPRDWPLRPDRPGFRLPTESEWEVACRGGMRTPYGHGADSGLLAHYAWFDANSENHARRPKTRRPGLRGLFDMHGNLYEWCHDWYSNDPAPGATGPTTGSTRVYRGGGWSFDAALCRSSYRNGNPPTYRHDFLGCRLAVTPSAALRSTGTRE